MAAKPDSRTSRAKDGGERAIRSKKILVVDIGGSQIKILATGQTKPRKIPSSKKPTP
jgi:hypothetical protein